MWRYGSINFPLVFIELLTGIQLFPSHNDRDLSGDDSRLWKSWLSLTLTFPGVLCRAISVVILREEEQLRYMIMDNGYEWTLPNTRGKQSVDRARETSQRLSAISHLPSQRYRSMSVWYRDLRRENDRMGNRIDNDDYNDMLDIMEWEYTFCRCSRRCNVADCVTFHAVSIKFRYFFHNLSWSFEETSCFHVRRHTDRWTWRRTHRGPTQWRRMNCDTHKCHQSLKFQGVNQLFIWFT
jgi:hypothetical protein